MESAPKFESGDDPMDDTMPRIREIVSRMIERNRENRRHTPSPEEIAEERQQRNQEGLEWPERKQAS